MTDHLAAFISSFDGYGLKPQVLEKATTGVIDGIAVIIAGANDETGEIAHRTLDQVGQLHGTTTIVGTALTAGMLDAAQCNGIAAHAHDYDDVLQGHTTHPTTHLLPPLLAIAEAQPVSGRDLLTAYVVGLEVELGMAMAMGRSHYNAGFHSTGTLGAIGATAAACRLLSLDATATLNAIGVATSSASGLRVNNGSSIKPLHAGHAARTGLEAAYLAANGFHGSPDPLYGKNGYFQAFQGTLTEGACRWETDDARLGTAVDWLSFKPFPCCGEGTAAVEASQELRTLVPVEEIDRVTVSMCTLAGEVMPFTIPSSPDQARFSMPYCVGVALHSGDLRLSDFTPEAIARPEVIDLIKRTEVTVDRDLEDPGAVVEVWSRGGRHESRTVITPTGNRKRGMPREVELGKFVQCAAGIFSTEESTRTFETLEDLVNVEDVGALVRSLVPNR